MEIFQLNNKNTRLKFDQLVHIHYDYLMHLYDLFKNFVKTEPKITNRKADKELVKFIIVLYLKH